MCLVGRPQSAAASPAGLASHPQQVSRPTSCLDWRSHRHSAQGPWAGLGSGGTETLTPTPFPQVALAQQLDDHRFFLQPKASVWLLEFQQPIWGGSPALRHLIPALASPLLVPLREDGAMGLERSLPCPPSAGPGGLQPRRMGLRCGADRTPTTPAIPGLDAHSGHGKTNRPFWFSEPHSWLPGVGDGVLGPTGQERRQATG